MDSDADGARQEAIAQRAVQKLHRRLLPPFVVMVVLCYIDRTNLAFASLSLNRDLSFTPEVYGLGSGLFFLGYSLFMIPSNLILMKVGAPRWLAVIIVAWGAAASCFGFMRTPTQFYLLRFLLGAAEAGAFPGMWYHLTHFYGDADITLPFTIVEAAMACSHAFAAPLAAGLLMLHGWGGFHGWQWLFIMEGLPSIALGLLMPTLLPPDLHSCDFLTPAERAALEERLAVTRSSKQRDAQAFADVQLVWHALHNGKLWYVSTLKALKNTAGYGILFWTPIIIQAMLQGSQSITGLSEPVATAAAPAHHSASTSSGATAVLLTAIPFAAASAAGIVNGWHSHRTGERPVHIAVPYAAAGVLFLAFPAAGHTSTVAAFVVLSLVIMLVNSAGGICTALASAAAAGPSVAVGLAVYNAVANIGGVLGPWVMGYLLQRTGTYTAAIQLLSTLLIASGVMAAFLRRQDGSAAGGKGHDPAAAGLLHSGSMEVLHLKA